MSIASASWTSSAAVLPLPPPGPLFISLSPGHHLGTINYHQTHLGVYSWCLEPSNILRDRRVRNFFFPLLFVKFRCSSIHFPSVPFYILRQYLFNYLSISPSIRFPRVFLHSYWPYMSKHLFLYTVIPPGADGSHNPKATLYFCTFFFSF